MMSPQHLDPIGIIKQDFVVPLSVGEHHWYHAQIRLLVLRAAGILVVKSAGSVTERSLVQISEPTR